MGRSSTYILLRPRTTVEPVDTYSYYRLGVAMNDLLKMPSEPGKFADVFFAVFEAQLAIDELMKSGLQHSKAAATDLKARLFELPIDNKDAEGKPDWNKPIPPWRVNQMKQAVRDFQVILIRECPAQPVFFIPQKGLHRTADLINQAELDFPEDIRRLLPATAIDEIRQGGKALALDMFTAYVFHAMRAAEIVMLKLLRDYYDKEVKQSERNWGSYIAIIKGNGGDPELVRYLNEMARIERNEGIHPSRLLTESEADMLYTVAKGAIMAMIRDLVNRSFYDSLVPAVTPPQKELVGIEIPSAPTKVKLIK